MLTPACSRNTHGRQLADDSPCPICQDLRQVRCDCCGSICMAPGCSRDHRPKDTLHPWLRIPARVDSTDWTVDDRPVMLCADCACDCAPVGVRAARFPGRVLTYGREHPLVNVAAPTPAREIEFEQMDLFS